MKPAVDPTLFGEKSTIFYKNFTVALLIVRRLLRYRSHCQRLAELGAYSRTRILHSGHGFGASQNRKSLIWQLKTRNRGFYHVFS